MAVQPVSPSTEKLFLVQLRLEDFFWGDPSELQDAWPKRCQLSLVSKKSFDFNEKRQKLILKRSKFLFEIKKNIFKIPSRISYAPFIHREKNNNMYF